MQTIKRITQSLVLLSAVALVTGCAAPQVLSSAEITEAGKQRMAQLETRKSALGDGVSLAEAMTWAMDNNLSLRAESLERAVATNNRKLAVTGMLPNLTAQAGYHSRSNLSASSSANAVTGLQSLVPSTSSDKESTTASLEASWNVLDFGLAWLSARSEGDKAHLAAESRRRMSHQLALEVVSAWDRALAFQRIEPVLHSTREEVMAALRQADTIAASRLRDPVDVLEYRSSLLLILKRMDSLVLQMDQSRDDLARLLGLPASTPISLDASGDLTLPAIPLSDLRALQYVALLNRPEILQSLYGKRMAERNGYKRLVEQFPSLMFKYGTNYDSNSFLVNNTWDDASISLSLGLMRLATLPLQRRLAAIEKDQAEVQADLQATAVLSQVALARKASVSSQRVSCLSNALASTSAERLGLLDARYSAAVVDELSMVRARVDNLLLRLEGDVALADSRRASLMLAQSVGIGAFPEQIAAQGNEARIEAIARWLQTGMVDKVLGQLVRVEKEFGVNAVPQVTAGASSSGTAGVSALCY